MMVLPCRFRSPLARPAARIFRIVCSFLITVLLSGGILTACGKSAEKGKPVLALPSPSNLATVSGAGKVTLKWKEVPGAVSYNIYFSNEAGLNTKKAAKIGGVKGAAYDHAGLSNGTTYFYVVTAVNASGEGLPSAEVGGMPRGAVPAQPSGVAASVAGEGAVSVKWNAVPAATSYRIYHAEKPGMAVTAKKVETAAANSFTHTGLKSGAYYFYSVAAVNDSGEGPLSPESGVLVKVSPPGPPANVSVAAYPDKVVVKWDAVAGAQSYNIYISKTEAFNRAAARKVSVTSNSYSHAGLAKGDRFFYQVTAVNGSGESPVSNKVGAKI